MIRKEREAKALRLQQEAKSDTKIHLPHPPAPTSSISASISASISDSISANELPKIKIEPTKPKTKPKTKPNAKPKTETLSPNPIFSLTELTTINAIKQRMALSLPSSFITPKAGHMFATERNRSNKDLQDFAEFVHILDVRCQSDIASHVVGSRSSTLIRGSVIYPFDRLKVQFAAFNVAVGAAVEAATENEDIFIEPLTANLINDPENTYLICCTDGQRSVLAWEVSERSEKRFLSEKSFCSVFWTISEQSLSSRRCAWPNSPPCPILSV